MQKTETKKKFDVVAPLSVAENTGLTSEVVDKLLAEIDELENPERELKTNINKLMDRIEDNDELKHLVQDRQQNKIISQNTLNKLRVIENIENTEFIPFDGTIDNLLLLAQDSDALAFAIENHTEKIIEKFKKITYRYTLIKEKPENHASLLHYVFKVSMRNYESDEKNFMSALRIPKRHKHDETSLKKAINDRTIGIERRRITENKYYFATYAYGSINRYAVFDKFGNIEIMPNSNEDHKTVKLIS